MLFLWSQLLISEFLSKNNVNVYYAIIECISEYDNYTWELEYINIWLLTCYPISGNLPAIGIIMNNFRTLYIIPIELSFTSPKMCNISNIKAGLLFSSVKASNYDAAFESVDMNYDESAWIHLWFIVLNDPPLPNLRKVLVEAGFTISESTSNIWCYASFMIWYTFLEIESRIAKTNFTLGPIENLFVLSSYNGLLFPSIDCSKGRRDHQRSQKVPLSKLFQ